MAITQCICNVFYYDLLRGLHDFDSHTFKMALYTSSASLGPTTAAYSATNEVSGTGYTAGGTTLTVTLTGGTDERVAYVDFADVVWASSTITARGALIYNDTHASDGAVAVLDFGSDRSSSSSAFTIKMPTASANDAIVRLARSK